MLKKECWDTLRVLLESSLLLLSIPVVMVVSLLFGLEAPTWDLIVAVAVLTVFAFSGYSGLTLFRAEKRQQGLEYLLTLPISRFKVFLYKMVPRFTLLILFSAIMMIFFDATFEHMVLPLLCFQLGAAFLSLAVDSYFLGFIGLFLLGFLYKLSYKIVGYFIYILGGRNFRVLSMVPFNYIVLLILGVPLAISFFLALKNLDLKPFKYSLKPYLYITLPVIVIQMILLLCFYDTFRYRFYF